MKEDFLESIWNHANQNRRKFVMMMLVLAICATAFIVFLVKVVEKEAIDFTDSDTRTIVMIFAVMGVIMLLSICVIVVKSLTRVKNGSNLIIPFGEKTREELAKMINTDYRDGKFLLDEPIHHFKENETQYGERVILTDSYMLIANVNSTGKVLSIPRKKIYWVCAQAGIKGVSSYVVRLLIFTEKEIFAIVGTETEYVEGLAEKLYHYIPNVFAAYDPFKLSYELEKCYEQNREGFLAFYEEEKQKING